jgi:endonuclease I
LGCWSLCEEGALSRVARGIAGLTGLAIGCLAASLSQGISGDLPTGQLEYSQFSNLQPGQIWLLLDRAEYWAIPLPFPPTYYATVQTSSTAALRSTLHDLIDDHTVYHYTTPATPDDPGFKVDTWDIIALADAHPLAPRHVLDLYLNGTFDRQYGGVTTSRYYYNREHSWPSSLGFDSDRSPAYADCHSLFAAYFRYNGSRSDSFYNICAQGICKPTQENLGRGGEDVCNMFCTQGPGWQIWEGRRGDVARAMFYMAIRYEGDAESEPDLELTNDIDRIAPCSAWQTQATAYMGLLSVLLEWHKNDPVDDLERRRNTIVYLFQGNRNPFVDHPEWVSMVFGG